MGRSGFKKTDMNNDHTKRGLIVGVSAGLTTVGMACAVAIMFSPGDLLSSKVTAASETSASVVEAVSLTQDQIWQDAHEPVAKTAVQMKVAIVNLDEGVILDGQKIRYSDQILRLPDERSYQFVSFSEARDGLEDGSFGAMIQIPASFSESVESINKIPDPCVLKYEINDLAKDSLRYNLLKKVYDFWNCLGNDMSFIYISNMMAQYHKAQDDASVVMANDQADLDALSGIQYADLVSLVEVKSFTGEILSAELPDLAIYTDRQSSLSNGLQENFDQALGSVIHAFEQVFDQAGRLGGKALSATDDIPPSLTHQCLDDTEAITSVNGLIMTHLEDEVADQREAEAKDQAALAQQIIHFGQVLNESIDNQNVLHEAKWSETLDDLTEGYQAKMPSLTFAVGEETVDIYYAGDNEDDHSPVFRIFRQQEDNVVSDDGLLDQKREIQYALMCRLAFDAGDTEARVDDTLADFEAVYASMLYECGYGSAADLLMDDLYTANTYNAGVLAVEGDMAELQAYLSEKTFDEEALQSAKEQFLPFEDLAYSEISSAYDGMEAGEDVIDRQADGLEESSDPLTLTGELTKIGQAIEDQSQKRLSGLDKMAVNMGAVLDTEGTETMKALFTDHADQALEDVTDKANEAIAQITSITSDLASDTEGFQQQGQIIAADVTSGDYQGAAYCMDMNANYGELLAACSLYGEDVRAYADDLHAATQQYGSDLVKDMARIKSDTDELLIKGLDGVREQRQRSYDENQSLLTDFINSLYHTRLGSRENNNLYRFVAAPVIAEDAADENVSSWSSQKQRTRP